MPAAAGDPKLIQSLELDGAVYASPIVVNGVTIVATEDDSVYGFDSNYHQVWVQRLGQPSPREERQCGNIDPLGITGTPVYDAGSGKVYVVAEQVGGVGAPRAVRARSRRRHRRLEPVRRPARGQCP